MSVRVLRPGLLTTLQDEGRHGYQRIGLCPGGAMDPVALALANALVGNAPGEAALEITVIGPEVMFEHDTLVAVCGAEFQGSFPHNRPTLAPAGSRFSVGGWGFPVSDEGSGAWLGLRAVRLAQRAMDGRINAGALVRHVWATCGHDRDTLQAWCDHARQFAYAQLAPAVFSHEAADPAAAQLLSRAVSSLDEIALALDPQGRLPLAVCGSVGRRLAGRLSPAVRSRMVDAADGPAAGALTMIRNAVDAL